MPVQTSVAYHPGGSPANKRRAKLEANLSRGSVLLRALSNGTLALFTPSGSSRGRSPALTPLSSPRTVTTSPRLEASGREPGLAVDGVGHGKGKRSLMTLPCLGVSILLYACCVALDCVLEHGAD